MSSFSSNHSPWRYLSCFVSCHCRVCRNTHHNSSFRLIFCNHCRCVYEFWADFNGRSLEGIIGKLLVENMACGCWKVDSASFLWDVLNFGSSNHFKWVYGRFRRGGKVARNTKIIFFSLCFWSFHLVYRNLHKNYIIRWNRKF